MVTDQEIDGHEEREDHPGMSGVELGEGESASSFP
jgi:hypothetical protein